MSEHRERRSAHSEDPTSQLIEMAEMMRTHLGCAPGGWVNVGAHAETIKLLDPARLRAARVRVSVPRVVRVPS